MDCVTARCGSQVQPTEMILAHRRVLSSSEVRASDLEHEGSWVRIPSGAQIFSVLLWLILYTSLYFLYDINISGTMKITVVNPLLTPLSNKPLGPTLSLTKSTNKTWTVPVGCHVLNELFHFAF